MSLELVDYERKAKEAVQVFWGNRVLAKKKQLESGKADQGERSSVTAGKNMDGFLALIRDLIEANGLAHAKFHLKRSALTLPGFFRPTKLWDILVTLNGELLIAIELKSQVGPSFGKNYNNRAEEAIGTAHDFWTAYREGAFGQRQRPFVGWLMLVEDAPESRAPIKDKSPHFPIVNGFETASYLKRYDLLCQKLVQEGLYSSAALIASHRSPGMHGEFTELSEMTSLKSFVTSLAGYTASVSARLS